MPLGGPGLDRRMSSRSCGRLRRCAQAGLPVVREQARPSLSVPFLPPRPVGPQPVPARVDDGDDGGVSGRRECDVDLGSVASVACEVPEVGELVRRLPREDLSPVMLLRSAEGLGRVACKLDPRQRANTPRLVTDRRDETHALTDSKPAASQADSGHYFQKTPEGLDYWQGTKSSKRQTRREAGAQSQGPRSDPRQPSHRKGTSCLLDPSCGTKGSAARRYLCSRSSFSAFSPFRRAQAPLRPSDTAAGQRRSGQRCWEPPPSLAIPGRSRNPGGPGKHLC